MQRDFSEVIQIGTGHFSTVYRARNNVDHCSYAIKKTNLITHGVPSQSQLREVFALAAVAIETESCPHIVRYFSSWFEDGRLHIQTELCEMSLRDRLGQLSTECARGKRHDPRMDPKELVHVLLHIAKGLTVLHEHENKYVHLDIKPDNILVSRGCYKIADLGLAVAAIGTGCDAVCEGDCRYLAREVMQGDLSNLPKADVFALGLVCYEMATNPHPLPMQGEDWQQLRNGVLDESRFSIDMPNELTALFLAMVRDPASKRPSCSEIVRHPSVAPTDDPRVLEEKLKQTTLLAEQSQQRADTYWLAMLELTKQSLVGHSPPKRDRAVFDGDVTDPRAAGPRQVVPFPRSLTM